MSTLPKLELGGAECTPVKRFPPAGNWPFMEMVDPVLQDSSSALSCDQFKNSDWTPPGCCVLGGYVDIIHYELSRRLFLNSARCLLCCLTKGGRLLLFTPPGMTGCKWTLLMGEEPCMTVVGYTPPPHTHTYTSHSHLISPSHISTSPPHTPLPPHISNLPPLHISSLQTSVCSTTFI